MISRKKKIIVSLILLVVIATAYNIRSTYVANKKDDAIELETVLANIKNVEIVFGSPFKDESAVLTKNQEMKLYSELHGASISRKNTQELIHGWVYQLHWEGAILSVHNTGLIELALKKRPAIYSVEPRSKILTTVAIKYLESHDQSLSALKTHLKMSWENEMQDPKTAWIWHSRKGNAFNRTG